MACLGCGPTSGGGGQDRMFGHPKKIDRDQLPPPRLWRDIGGHDGALRFGANFRRKGGLFCTLFFGLFLIKKIKNHAPIRMQDEEIFSCIFLFSFALLRGNNPWGWLKILLSIADAFEFLQRSNFSSMGRTKGFAFSNRAAFISGWWAEEMMSIRADQNPRRSSKFTRTSDSRMRHKE